MPVPELSFEIEIIFAHTQGYQIQRVKVEAGCLVEEAIHRSGILSIFPEINLRVPGKPLNKVGSYGEFKALTDEVKPEDRIEIYQPLPQSAQKAREQRAKEQINRRFQRPLRVDHW